MPDDRTILPTLTLPNPETIANIISATVDRLRQRNLTCSRSNQHVCCIPNLLNELLNYRADFAKPLLSLCDRLRWNSDLLSQIAVEWQARNSSEERLFGFDSTVILSENLWRDEQQRRDEWGSSITSNHQEAFIKFLRDVGDCLRRPENRTDIDENGRGRDVSGASGLLHKKSREITVTVRTVGSL